MTTAEKNAEIARFMGAKQYTSYYKFGAKTHPEMFDFENGKTFKQRQLKYHSDWNWIMDCVSKIESLGFIFSIKEQSSAIRDKKTRKYLQIRLIGEDSSKIESVYNTCFQFIQWYNQQKQ